MSNFVDVIPKVIAAAPSKKIVGKIRLQKIFYLLDQLGLNGNLRFSYHHYGPYCEDLSTAIDVAHHFNSSIKEELETAQSHGGKFSVFTTEAAFPSGDSVGSIDQPHLAELLRKMTSTSSVVIELAATIHWLKNAEKIELWEPTLKSRKPTKTTASNIEKATALLDELGLAA